MKKMTRLIVLSVIGFLAAPLSAAVGPCVNGIQASLNPAPNPYDVLQRSQIAYRAEGGFSGVESYGVIISCVKGEVSVMSSIHDPRIPDGEPIRRFEHMNAEKYLALWNSLVKQAGLKL